METDRLTSALFGRKFTSFAVVTIFIKIGVAHFKITLFYQTVTTRFLDFILSKVKKLVSKAPPIRSIELSALEPPKKKIKPEPEQEPAMELVDPVWLKGYGTIR